MRKCRKCGCENPDDSLFCGDCGEKLTGPPKVPTEMEVLVDLAREKDEEAIEKLVRMTEKKLYYIAYNFLKDKDSAMSVLQDTYEYNFKKLDQLRDNSKFESWLAVSVSNRCRNELKKLNRNNEVNMSSFDDVDENLSFEENIADESMEFRPEENMNYEELKVGLSEVMAELPENQRMSILLVYLQGMKVSEASEALGIPEGTIKSNINYGKKAIKAKIEELRAQNKSFYAVAPIPFLIWMLKEEMDKMESPGIVVHASTIEPVVQKAATGSKASSATAAKTAAGTVGKSAVSKVVVGVVTAAVVGTGAFVGGKAILGSNEKVADGEKIAETSEDASSDSSSEKEEKFSTSVFDGVLKKYQKIAYPYGENTVIDGNVTYSVDSEDTGFLSLKKEMGGSYSMGYAFVDINGDGQEELLIAEGGSETDTYTSDTICDIYAYVDGKVTLISDDIDGENNRSSYVGMRSVYRLTSKNELVHNYGGSSGDILGYTSIGEFNGKNYGLLSKYVCYSNDYAKNGYVDYPVKESAEEFELVTAKYDGKTKKWKMISYDDYRSATNKYDYDSEGYQEIEFTRITPDMDFGV